MAKFERFRYIPMLVRAYQEARTRADSNGHQPMPPSALGDIAMRATDMASSKAQTTYKESGAKLPLNRNEFPKRTGTKRPLQAPQSAVQSKSTKKATKHLARTQKPTPRVKQAALRSNPVVQNLLRELRATKQQLGQLSAIQTQLAEVQLKLDEQLRVLRETVDSDKKQLASTEEPSSNN